MAASNEPACYVPNITNLGAPRDLPPEFAWWVQETKEVTAEVYERAGSETKYLVNALGLYDAEISMLVGANDAGFTFDEIADFLEAHPETHNMNSQKSIDDCNDFLKKLSDAVNQRIAILRANAVIASFEAQKQAAAAAVNSSTTTTGATVATTYYVVSATTANPTSLVVGMTDVDDNYHNSLVTLKEEPT